MAVGRYAGSALLILKPNWRILVTGSNVCL